MSTEAELVEAEIWRSFPRDRPEGLGPVSEGDREENARLRADLAAIADWTTLPPEAFAEIDRNSGFGFLTRKAAQFYLPAFLIADLRRKDLNPDPVFSLRVFDPTVSTDEIIACQLADLRRRWDNLDLRQAAAVVRYLEWRIAFAPRGNENGAAYSLSAYWYQRT